MNIRSDKNSAIVNISRDELSGYGVDFGSMSLDDLPTRVMLDDILRLLGHMGALDMHTYDERQRSRLTIECSENGEGDCTIILHNVQRNEKITNRMTAPSSKLFLFEDADEVCAAAKAGALCSGDVIYTAANERYVIRAAGDISEARAMLLGEFGRAI